MNFSQRLQNIMSSNKITNIRLSKQLKVSPSTIANWLNGQSRPNIERIRQLADFFGVSTDYLLTGAPTPDSTRIAGKESSEQLEELLLADFRKMSINDKIAVLQHAESLARGRQTIDANNEALRADDFMFAEAGHDTKYQQLTSDDIRKLKIMLKKYDDENR